MSAPRAVLASICSMTFFPSAVSLGSSIGYLPSKQAAQSRDAGCSVAAIKPRRRDVSQRVGVDGMPHRFEHLVFVFDGVSDQLGRRREVDAVEAGPLHRGRRDPHMHFDGAGLPQHPDQSTLGIAPHDRVVDDDEPLAADDFLERVELQPDAELPDGLRRLDERTPDVGVLHQALPVGDAGFLRIADRGRDAGFRNADHQVGVDRAFPGESATDIQPGAVHRPARDRAVRPRQVDVFEDAALGFGVGEAGRPDAVGVDRQQLARLDVANERGADDVQSGGFGRHHPAAVQPSQSTAAGRRRGRARRTGCSRP